MLIVQNKFILDHKLSEILAESYYNIFALYFLLRTYIYYRNKNEKVYLISKLFYFVANCKCLIDVKYKVFKVEKNTFYLKL